MVLVKSLNAELKVESPKGQRLDMAESFSSRSTKPLHLPEASRAKREERRANMAVARASKVARAKHLAHDPRYPSDEVLTSIARLFARHWNS